MTEQNESSPTPILIEQICTHDLMLIWEAAGHKDQLPTDHTIFTSIICSALIDQECNRERNLSLTRQVHDLKIKVAEQEDMIYNAMENSLRADS